MKIAFVTTCKGRTQHVSRTLPRNMADNPDAKFVLLDYNDGGELERYVRENHMPDIHSRRLAFYQYRADVPFQMAKSKNLVSRCALLEGADILVNIDGDNFCGPGFERYVAEQIPSGEEIFLYSVMVKGVLTRGVSGRIAITKQAFLLSQGYHEIYDTHSPDDRDLNMRLRLLGFTGREIPMKFLNAIAHCDKMRYREYKHAADCTYDDFHVHPDHAVVNEGKVGCGTVFKNFSDEPIEIGPIPSRIFGIGLHKCATTSLHTALSLLGFKSGHWRTAHWAKALWREMNSEGRSHTLERFYAVCDLPIPLLYRQLDISYPGSKFILTTRDEGKWLESVRRHFSYEHNRFRHQWDTDPISHRLHEVLYGRTDFHEQTFLERYRRHNADVLDYFKDRPDDLLQLEMDNGHGWKELCSFLKVPHPTSTYPAVGASQKS